MSKLVLLSVGLLLALGCQRGPRTRDYAAGKAYVEDQLKAARGGTPNPSFETFLFAQTQLAMQSANYRKAVHTAEPLAQYTEIVYGADGVETAVASEMLADVYCNLKRCPESIPILERAAAIYRKHRPETAVPYIRTLNSLGATWDIEGRPDRAEPILRESLTLSEQEFGNESEQVGVVCWLLVTTYNATGDSAEASAFKTRAERLLPAREK